MMSTSSLSDSATPKDVTLPATDPPVDGTFTVDQLYEWRGIHSPEFPCLLWTDNTSEKTCINWREMGMGIDRAADKIKRDIGEISGSPTRPLRNGHPKGDRNIKLIVVGILATTELITYSTFFVALQRLTHPTNDGAEREDFALLPFPISTRNSPAATAHLIRKANVKYVYVSEGPMMNMFQQALQEAGDEMTITVLDMPKFADLFPPVNPFSTVSRIISPPVNMDSPAVILHSSGSTAFPKPITLTHRTLLEWTNCIKLERLAFTPLSNHKFDYLKNLNKYSYMFLHVPGYGGMKTRGEIWAVHACPAFHAMGVLGIMWAPAHLLIRAVPSPHANLPPPTPEYFLSQIVESGSTVLYCVPSFLEAWAAEESSIQVLTKLKILIYAGAPLSEKTGVLLRKKGVNLRSALGATEYGQVCLYPAEPFQEGYDWLGFSPITIPRFIPQDQENVYELVFKEGPRHHLSVHNTYIDGSPAYASNDLVEQHPTNKKLWRIVGRKDDQIMLSTGEKTNPGPLEQIISRNLHVRGSVLFGRGRLQNGVIVDPEPGDNFMTEEAFRDAVWPSVEEANAFAPSHSRIFKEMILIASPEKPFTYTAKGTPRRGGIVKDYESEIEALYASVKDSSQTDIQAPCKQDAEDGWSVVDTVNFINKVVRRVMKAERGLRDTDDFFKAGCNSLEATYIRNTVLRGLRESSPACQIHKIPTNFVYQHPSIQRLATYVAKVSCQEGTVNGQAVGIENLRVTDMDDMVDKYTRHFPTYVASTYNETSCGEVIFLTGSTGGLGSQILAQLVAIPTVSTIYAFNRPSRSGASSLHRQHEAFIDRGNEPGILSSHKIRFVEGDASLESLGIPGQLLDEIRKSVTVIVHNAWQVDFKMMLPSFEPAIRGVRNLVDLALRSPHSEPPRFIFTSSIGILRNWLPENIPEAPVVDSGLINNSGYGASKWVSERILLEAAAVTPLKPVIIRVGQLAGGLNGCWNIQEWFPSLIRGSQILGCLPDNEGLVSWVPLHAAAAAVVDLRNAPLSVAHLVHPQPVPWTVVAQHVSRLLKIALVPYETWLSNLQSVAGNATEADLNHNPALRLLEFYTESRVPDHVSDLNSRETMGLATLATKITSQEAPSLREEKLLPLREEDVNSWISYWQKKGFLEV